MARRERTTGLPRAKPSRRAHSAEPRILGIAWKDAYTRLAVLGAAGLLLLAIVAAFAYNIYEDRRGTPNKVVLRVGPEKYSLNYYADRLGQYLQANTQSGSTVQLLEEDLLTKLEREAVGVVLAREKGISLGKDAVTQQIASTLGVPVGGTGSSFDTLYRNQLKTLKVSDSNFRKQNEAALANAKLIEMFKTEVGTKGTQYTLRAVLVSKKEDADAIFLRVKNGEDLGTIAQTESLDLESKQKDGLLTPEAPELIPEAVRKLLEGAKVKDLIGPVQVQQLWWISRIERIEEDAYSETQQQQIAASRLDAAITAKRAELASKIKQSLSGSDIKWAEKHLN